jgi:hypothetical protein
MQAPPIRTKQCPNCRAFQPPNPQGQWTECRYCGFDFAAVQPTAPRYYPKPKSKSPVPWFFWASIGLSAALGVVLVIAARPDPESFQQVKPRPIVHQQEPDPIVLKPDQFVRELPAPKPEPEPEAEAPEAVQTVKTYLLQSLNDADGFEVVSAYSQSGKIKEYSQGKYRNDLVPRNGVWTMQRTELEPTAIHDGQVVEITYRARNAFGAKVLDRQLFVVINGKVTKSFPMNLDGVLRTARPNLVKWVNDD